MTNLAEVPVFVSSAHYGLEDLRAELAAFLPELGTQPFVSSETGFPDQPDLPPYAQCLPVLERCLIVIGIIDRRYGEPFQEWGPYSQYAGLSPTHAELRHAFSRRKRVLIYVRDSLAAYHDLYRKNRDQFSRLELPPGLDTRSLDLFAELKRMQPAPFIEKFADVRDIKVSIRRRLLRDLYEALLRREELAKAGAEYLIERLLKLEPTLLRQLSESLLTDSGDLSPRVLNFIEDYQETVRFQTSYDELVKQDSNLLIEDLWKVLIDVAN